MHVFKHGKTLWHYTTQGMLNLEGDKRNPWLESDFRTWMIPLCNMAVKECLLVPILAAFVSSLCIPD